MTSPYFEWGLLEKVSKEILVTRSPYNVSELLTNVRIKLWWFKPRPASRNMLRCFTNRTMWRVDISQIVCKILYFCHVFRQSSWLLCFPAKKGNIIIHFTWHACGQSRYQLPVKESLVCGPSTDKQVKNQSCPTSQHLPWVLPLGPTSLGNHYLGKGST